MSPTAPVAAPRTTAGTPAAWEQVLDRECLDRLRELDPTGRGGLLRRVLATYTQSLDRLLDQLAAARREADPERVRHVSHTLKSSSASVGALQLSTLCADVERKVRDGRAEGLDAQLDALVREAARVLAALSTTEPR
jgi:HPt (histidine-containing phosphotransfer) domain-containing protein